MERGIGHTWKSRPPGTCSGRHAGATTHKITVQLARGARPRRACGQTWSRPSFFNGVASALEAAGGPLGTGRLSSASMDGVYTPTKPSGGGGGGGGSCSAAAGAIVRGLPLLLLP